MFERIVSSPSQLGPEPPMGSRRPSPASAATLMVADLVCTRVVRLPAWFSVAQARKVVALRGVDYALVEEHGKVSGSVNRASLWRANGSDPLARCVRRSSTSVSADMTALEARARMLESGSECVPVVKGGIFVGTISLADIDFNLERPAMSA
jgi:CBS domain-containing protein